MSILCKASSEMKQNRNCFHLFNRQTPKSIFAPTVKRGNPIGLINFRTGVKDITFGTTVAYTTLTSSATAFSNRLEVFGDAHFIEQP